MDTFVPGTPLPFEKTENFRQLGGYTGADGRQVKCGQIYRSGALADAVRTPHDKALLESLGLRSIFDFRSSQERSFLPDPALPGARQFDISAMVSSDGQEVNFDIASFFTMTADQLNQVFQQVHLSYAALPFENEAYKEMFRQLLAGNTPLLFHCSAGKDRTGVAAALILLALGVSRQDVMEDYLLTNTCRAATRAELGEKFAAAMGNTPARDAVVNLFTGVQRESLELALDAIDQRYPSFEAYLQDQYGIGAAGLEKLRQMYLE